MTICFKIYPDKRSRSQITYFSVSDTHSDTPLTRIIIAMWIVMAIQYVKRASRIDKKNRILADVLLLLCCLNGAGLYIYVKHFTIFNRARFPFLSYTLVRVSILTVHHTLLGIIYFFLMLLARFNAHHFYMLFLLFSVSYTRVYVLLQWNCCR